MIVEDDLDNEFNNGTRRFAKGTKNDRDNNEEQ
jgi:hypothetical protein